MHKVVHVLQHHRDKPFDSDALSREGRRASLDAKPQTAVSIYTLDHCCLQLGDNRVSTFKFGA